MTPVIIVGAGPTGLLLANLLGTRGVSTVVLEKRASPPFGMGSRAIGVTPPSLEILDGVGLAAEFVHTGLPITTAVVHGTRSGGSTRVLGDLRFSTVHERFPFILSIPQHTTRAILEEGLRRYDCVHVTYDQEVVSWSELENGAGCVVRSRGGSKWTGAYCVAADGAHGTTARSAGIAHTAGIYRPQFFMGDFHDRSDLGDEAHLWFTRDGAVESFPLPNDTRRWIVQLTDRQELDLIRSDLQRSDLPRSDLQRSEPANVEVHRERSFGRGATRPEPASIDLEGIVEHRTGYTLGKTDRQWESAFLPAWSEAEVFHRGRLFLLGDAAHTMSPIGGQGMNTGFADAELLATTLETLLENPHHQVYDEAVHHETSRSAPRTEQARTTPGMPITPAQPATPAQLATPGAPITPNQYQRLRRRASRAATRRAAAGMTVGCLRGGVISAVRNTLVWVVLRPVFRSAVARHFAMITIPHGRAKRTPTPRRTRRQ